MKKRIFLSVLLLIFSALTFKGACQTKGGGSDIAYFLTGETNKSWATENYFSESLNRSGYAEGVILTFTRSGKLVIIYSDGKEIKTDLARWNYYNDGVDDILEITISGYNQYTFRLRLTVLQKGYSLWLRLQNIDSKHPAFIQHEILLEQFI